MSLLNIVPKFLYPNSRQFPFDEVAEKIVRELSKRNFDVPGIKVKLDVYGSGEEKYRVVRKITGKDFYMYFYRIQGKLNDYLSDTAALYHICLPMHEISVYHDESGPTYYKYVGKDWEKDKEWFMNSIKFHSKLRCEPKRYLKYKGTTYKQRTTILTVDTDIDREYGPDENEPKSLYFDDVFNEFITWLTDNVLSYITTFPEKECTAITAPVEENIIPYKGPWPVIYSVCNEKDGKRILKGIVDASTLEPKDRHAYFGIGKRLVSFGVHSTESIPKIAFDGFIWCDTNQEIFQCTPIKSIIYEVRSAHFLFSDCNIVAIAPKYANGIFVADNAEYVETRKKLFEEIAPRERLTDEEIDRAYAKRGLTIVPINEYTGGYKQPIVLINRELDFDEIKWLSYHKTSTL